LDAGIITQSDPENLLSNPSHDNRAADSHQSRLDKLLNLNQLIEIYGKI
jgi:hypothetical protein